MSLAVALSPAHLLSLPLDQLLTDTSARLVESSITDDGFCGAVVVRGKRVTLLMPPHRSPVERDVIARSLLGRALGVQLSPLPEVFTMIELPV